MNLITRANEDLISPEDYVSYLNGVSGTLRKALVPGRNEVERAMCVAERRIEDAHAIGVEVVGYGGSKYPRRLINIPDPPPVLFFKGNLDSIQRDIAVALIGTREPSNFGCRSAFKIGARLAEASDVVVSGLAKGCDFTGHSGCLSENGICVAVLAHGLDKVYPATSRELADAILEKGGCLVSEYAVGTKPQRSNFVDRDRIQSGLSDAVIVVETNLKGGSMHTVRFCELQGRALACVKHPPEFQDIDTYLGNALLIDEGRAVGIATHDDLMAFISGLKDRKSPEKIKHENQAFAETNDQGVLDF